MKKQIFSAIILGISFSILFSPQIHAQTTSQPQPIITWRAMNSYAPSAYMGKILPNQESTVLASLELINNGKLVDLSGTIIYWYQDDTLIGGGIGQQSISFHPFGEAPNTVTLRADISGLSGNPLMYEISVPMTQPLAVIEAPYPQNTFSASQANLTALPYFFDASSSAPLSFVWTVNDQPVTSAMNPQTLQVSLPASTPSGYSVAVSLSIKNAINTLTGNSTINLTYQPQP